jgi:hypothetical protein
MTKAAFGPAGRRALLLLALPVLAWADDPVVELGAVVDVRYVRTDSLRSWLERGPGKLRYGAGVGGSANLLRLSQLSLLLDAELSPTLSAIVQLNADAEPDEEGLRSRVDLVEAFVAYRPDLSARVQLRVRGGAFFPPVSLEHLGPAWTSVYSITGAAANSWIGEELRAVGAEATLILRGERDQLRLLGAGFGSNDPTGTLLAWRGWAIHDRQTGFGDRLAYPDVPEMRPGGQFEKNARWVGPMQEIDGRLGWYAGVTALRSGVYEARALCYDNRAEQAAFDGWQYAWLTRFNAFGLRVELPGSVHLVGQHVRGDTHMGRTTAGEDMVSVAFATTFGLLSLPVQRHRLTARYERFESDDQDALPVLDANQEQGSAWTLAYAFQATDAVRLAVEVVRIEAERAVRPLQGFPLRSDETLVQLSLRVAF